MKDDEYRMEDIDDEKTIAYIKAYLPQEMKARFTDDDLYYILDVLADYYATSDIFDQEPDADGYINIDLDPVVDYVMKEAAKDGMGPWEAEEVFFVVQGEMEYADSLDE